MKTCKMEGCTKEATGYKWCDECNKIAIKQTNVKYNKKRVTKRKSPCSECGVTLTNTKYCRSCAQTVRRAQMISYNKEFVKPKIRTRKCRVPGCKNKMYGRQQYCGSCKKDREITQNLAKNEREKIKRKGAVHKEPIDPKWLTRGQIKYEGYE